MDIAILGAGTAGRYAASVLSKEMHDVIVIDRDILALEKLSRENDLAVLHGSLPDGAIFESLLENRPDFFFAATGHDETNLVACSIAKHLGIQKTIARIKSREYLNQSSLDFHRLFYADHFIGAEWLAAQDLFQTLVHAEDVAAQHFAHGSIHMRTVTIPDLWDKGGCPISDLKLPDTLIAGLIRRKLSFGEKILFPRGHDQILPGDEVTFLGQAKSMHHLPDIFHFPKSKIRSVILAGGSAIAEHLAYFLASQHIRVRIIESESERCEELAKKLPQATIIHQDGSDQQLLCSEQVSDADALVACTHQDSLNFLIAALAKQLGCKKAIALLNQAQYAPLVQKAGVLPALSAQVNAANRLLTIVHDKAVVSVASLCQDQAKIIELKVSPSSKSIGVPLAELNLPRDLLIAVIENQGKVMIGRGNRILSSGDTVIVLCPPEQIPKLPTYFH